MMHGLSVTLGVAAFAGCGGSEISSLVTSKSYAAWRAEPAAHAAGAESPHGYVRVYFNDAAAKSLEAGSAPLPVGSVIVKELYSADLTTLVGHSVMQKTSARWTWFEALNTEGRPSYHGEDLSVCTGCHSAAGNVDQVLSRLP